MSEGKPAFSIADLAPSHEASAGLHYRDPNTLRTPSGPGESVYNYAEDDMGQEPIEISKDDGTTTFRLDGGYIRIKENSRWAQGAHSVVDFTVREDRRRRGIGRRLVSEVIRYYPDDEISAQVTGSNSLSLFLSEGFEYFGDNSEGARRDFASYGTVNLRFNPRPELGKSITKKESLKSLHKKAFGLQMSAVPGNEAAIAGQSFHDEENREASFHTGFGGPDNIDSEEAWSPANIERKVMVNEIDDKEPINIPYKTESKDYFSFLETGRLGRTRKITRGSVMNNLENERVELTKLASALRSSGHIKSAERVFSLTKAATALPMSDEHKTLRDAWQSAHSLLRVQLTALIGSAPNARLSPEEFVKIREQIQKDAEGIVNWLILNVGTEGEIRFGSQDVVNKVVALINQAKAQIISLAKQYYEAHKAWRTRGDASTASSGSKVTPKGNSKAAPKKKVKGPWVAVQKKLNKLGYTDKYNDELKPDGWWGELTESALTRAGVTTTKAAGPQAALDLLNGKAGAAEAGAKAAEAKELTQGQKDTLLKYLLYDGKIAVSKRPKAPGGKAWTVELASKYINDAKWGLDIWGLYNSEPKKTELEYDLFALDTPSAKTEAEEGSSTVSADEFYNPQGTNIWMLKRDGSLYWAPKGDTGKMMPLTNRTSRLSGNNNETGSMSHREGRAMIRLLKGEVKSGNITDAQRDDYISGYRAQRSEERPGGLSGDARREKANRMGKR